MLSENALNEAKWAACNFKYENHPPTMEEASEVALRAVAAYLGLNEEQWNDVTNPCNWIGQM